MVTVLAPEKRRVSIWATTAVSSPGARVPLRAVAVTQPQETRTLAMETVVLVLLTRRKGCCSVGPRGTEPKSLDRSSNMASAHVAALAGPARLRPARRTRL